MCKNCVFGDHCSHRDEYTAYRYALAEDTCAIRPSSILRGDECKYFIEKEAT